MRGIALERWNLNRGENGDGYERRHCGRDGERAWRGWDPVRRIRQDDPMPMMIGRDQLDKTSVIHPVTVGWKARAQRPEDDQQEARHQLVRS